MLAQSFVPLKLRPTSTKNWPWASISRGCRRRSSSRRTARSSRSAKGISDRTSWTSLLREVLAERRGPAKGERGSRIALGSRRHQLGPIRVAPRAKRGLALSGYCPVSLISDRRLVPGQAEYTVQHEGRAYRFANLVMSNLFRKDPDRYVPVNRGDCPVSQVDRGTAQPGDPRWGVLYQGRLFLCATEEARRRFLKDPERYAMVDVAEQGFCPHCLGETGLLVRGDPKFEVTREGRRYWFPNPSHRDAFLTATNTAATNTAATRR